MASGNAAVQPLIAACIQHLSDNAAPYYDVVRSRPDAQPGILWAVFTPAKANPSSAVDVKKVSFLPLTTVVSANAPSLFKMHEACNPATQFVAWFTLESSHGEPVASKVMLVDLGSANPSNGAGGSSPVAQANPTTSTPGRSASFHATSNAARNRHHQSPPNAVQQPHQGRAPSGHTAAIEALKADMHAFQRQRTGGRVGVTGGATPGATREREAFAASLGGGNPGGYPEVSSSSVAGGDAAGGHGGSGNGSISDTAHKLAHTASSAQSYQQVLRVTLQIADTVARLGQTVEQLEARVKDLEHSFASQTRPPDPALISSMCSRIDTLESSAASASDRGAAIENVQAQYFESLRELERRLEATDTAVRKLAAAAVQGHGDDSAVDAPISYEHRLRARLGQADQQRRDEHEAAATGAMSFHHTRAVTTPRAVGGVALPSFAVPKATNVLAGIPMFDATTGGGNGIPGQHLDSGASSRSQSQADLNRPSGSPSGAPGGGNGGAADGPSLSDMIKAMERKLSRIRSTTDP